MWHKTGNIITLARSSKLGLEHAVKQSSRLRNSDANDLLLDKNILLIFYNESCGVFYVSPHNVMAHADFFAAL